MWESEDTEGIESDGSHSLSTWGGVGGWIYWLSKIGGERRHLVEVEPNNGKGTGRHPGILQIYEKLDTVYYL